MVTSEHKLVLSILIFIYIFIWWERNDNKYQKLELGDDKYIQHHV